MTKKKLNPLSIFFITLLIALIALLVISIIVVYTKEDPEKRIEKLSKKLLDLIVKKDSKKLKDEIISKKPIMVYNDGDFKTSTDKNFIVDKLTELNINIDSYDNNIHKLSDGTWINNIVLNGTMIGIVVNLDLLREKIKFIHLD